MLAAVVPMNTPELGQAALRAKAGVHDLRQLMRDVAVPPPMVPVLGVGRVGT